MQAAWRGYYIRLHDQDVARLLLDLYENRRQEALNAMCVFIQATVRRLTVPCFGVLDSAIGFHFHCYNSPFTDTTSHTET